MTQEYTCRHCRKAFSIYRSPAHLKRHPPTYCSRECSARGRTKKRPVACQQCGNPVLLKRYRVQKMQDRGPFCGFGCYAKWQSEHLRGDRNPAWVERLRYECLACEKTFELRPGDRPQLYCSRQCFLQMARAPYPSPDACYNSEWERNRAQALDRDRHHCVHCESTERLVVHHKQPIREILAEAVHRAHALGNLETTCEGCHGRQHSRLRRSRKPNR